LKKTREDNPPVRGEERDAVRYPRQKLKKKQDHQAKEGFFRKKGKTHKPKEWKGPNEPLDEND